VTVGPSVGISVGTGRGDGLRQRSVRAGPRSSFSSGSTPPSAIVILHLTPSSLPPQPSVTPEEVFRFTRPPLPRGWCAVMGRSGVGRNSNAETTEVGWLDVGTMLGSYR
jgi:hypothetical protein